MRGSTNKPEIWKKNWLIGSNKVFTKEKFWKKYKLSKRQNYSAQNQNSKPAEVGFGDFLGEIRK